MTPYRRVRIWTPMLLAAALPIGCSPTADRIDPQGKTFDGVAPQDVVTLSGTEPFWTLVIDGGQAVWTTPDDQSGTRFAAQRFAGNNGLGFSGTLDGKPIAATLTPGECSDGMSDRQFPFVATVAWGDETYEGCGHTGAQAFTGEGAS